MTASAGGVVFTDRSAREFLRVLSKRLLLSLITLWLLSVLVFAGGQLLPGDVGRAILGPLADARAVANLDHQLGTDRPLLIQYWDWISHFVTGDMGMSYLFRAPVAPFIATALVNSLKLAAVAFVLVVPLSIFGGVWAALHVGRALDRIISVAGLSATVLPEFVSGIVLILIFGVWLDWLPITRQLAGGLRAADPDLLSAAAVAAAGAGALRLYRAHGARRHHRGAGCRLHPHRDPEGPAAAHRDLAPRAAQRAAADHHRDRDPGRLSDRRAGGGGDAVPLSGHRRPDLHRRARPDFPMLEAGVLTVGIIYTVATLFADLLYSVLNPRIRVGAVE